MLRVFVLIISILYSCFALANASYQVDLILFAHPKNSDKNEGLTINAPLIPISNRAISLKTNSAKFYGLLSPLKSGLHDEYYLLSRRSRFKVLGNYSWIQPGTNQSSVALPNTNHNGWLLQGTVKVTQGSYYQLDADIQVSPPNHSDTSFTVSQKQRLKGNTVYFLDHPEVGMLIKVHKLT